MRLLPVVLVLACSARERGPSGTGDLSGFSAPLRSSPGLKLAVDGDLNGTPAEVVFDVASPMSRVAKGCFEEPPSTGGTVRIPRPDGETDAAAEVLVQGLTFG